MADAKLHFPHHVYSQIPGVVCPMCGAKRIDVTGGIFPHSISVCLSCGHTDVLKNFWRNDDFLRRGAE